MTFAELDFASILLRSTVYVATIATAGGVLFYATVRGAGEVSGAIRRQMWLGTLLLLAVEPLRYLQFKLAISGGDWEVAFDPSMRWMAFETPIGQAAVVRIAAAVTILLAGLRLWPIALAAALAMVGSFALEGHTASHEGDGWVPAALIVVHLAMVHWWLGALYPLRAATLVVGDSNIRDLVERFGKLALAAVAVLTAAGALLMAMLAGWQVDLSRNHQVALVAKLAIFALIMTMAAVNKFKWTPLLVTAPDAGRTGLRGSLNMEIAFCGLILIATAVMTSFPPASD